MNIKSIKPMPGYLVVQMDEPKSKSGKIFLINEEQINPFEGKVVAVGEYKNGKPPVKVGNRVRWKPFLGQDFLTDDKRHYKLLQYGELMAIV